MNLLWCIEYYYADYFYVDVMLISTHVLVVCIVWVDEQATEEPGSQQVENSEKELAKGKLCPWSLFFTQ
jgi:hypothetical protein